MTSIGHILGWASLGLALAGVLLMVIGLRGRSGRGKRRCGRCWYDMSGVPGLKCPECGRAARDERGLQRRRRSRGAMAAGLVVLVLAYGAGVGPRVYARGWIGLVPTTAMIAALPWYIEDSPTFIGWGTPRRFHEELWLELWRRGLEMWPWQRRWLIVRCARGDSDRAVGSESWGKSYRLFLYTFTEEDWGV